MRLAGRGAVPQAARSAPARVRSWIRPSRRMGWLPAVAGRGDVGLDRVLGGVRRIAGRHHPFVEGAGGSVTVVAADAEDDGSLFPHGVVARDIGALPVVEGGQAAG